MKRLESHQTGKDLVHFNRSTTTNFSQSIMVLEFHAVLKRQVFNGNYTKTDEKLIFKIFI